MNNNAQKTMILNSEKLSNFKAILNLKCKDKSEIKFFNLNNNIKNLALGIKQEQKIIKIPLDIKNNNCNFVLNEDINLEQKYFCAVVDVSNAFCPEIILSGSNNSCDENNNIENAFVQSKPEEISTLYHLDDEQNIENVIDKNLEEDLSSTYYDNCSKCKYRDAFYNECDGDLSNASVLNDLPPKLFDEDNSLDEFNKENEEELDDNHTFFEQIKPQLDALFLKYPVEETLNNIIPNSNWIKVSYEDSEGFYVLGLIYNDNDEILYISYGVPAVDNSSPPSDLASFAEWLPLDMQKPESTGYWIVCQDANTGETLKIDLI